MNHRPLAHSPAWLSALLTVVLLACNGAGAGPSEPEVAAERNEANLTLTDNLASTELLNAKTGEITDLGQVVTGDRAVLVWYWAPN